MTSHSVSCRPTISHICSSGHKSRDLAALRSCCSSWRVCWVSHACVGVHYPDATKYNLPFTRMAKGRLSERSSCSLHKDRRWRWNLSQSRPLGLEWDECVLNSIRQCWTALGRARRSPSLTCRQNVVSPLKTTSICSKWSSVGNSLPVYIYIYIYP